MSTFLIIGLGVIAVLFAALFIPSAFRDAFILSCMVTAVIAYAAWWLCTDRE
jgi:hypothetical protein